MAVGAVASNYAANFMTQKGMNPKLNAGIRLGVGALLPAFLGESKKAGLITDFANGMMSDAAVSLAREFKVPGVKGTELDDPINGIGAYTGADVTGTDVTSTVN